MVKRDSSRGTFVITPGSSSKVKRGTGKGVIVDIVTPAGTFKTMSKDVLDRAKRATNTALKSGGEAAILGPRGDARQR
ncbi:hypothetical protein ACQKJ1_24350 [Methylorubrum rhodesianum]|uniref:hypothetical protein n=1 Tax=Methylorubrum rhodesianum TaxID=29427 RepID=UPI003D0065CA